MLESINWKCRGGSGRCPDETTVVAAPRAGRVRPVERLEQRLLFDNTAPVNTVPGDQNMVENGSLVFSAANGNAIGVADADAGGGEIAVLLGGLGGGTIALGSLAGLAFDLGDGTGDATVQFRGTLAAVNAALDGLTYTPAPGFSGADVLNLSVNDQGHAGPGGPMGDADAVIIRIAAIGTLGFSAATYTAAEGAGVATITVARTGGTAGAVSVAYATAPLSATPSWDFASASGVLSFADGEASKTFDIILVDDALDENDESVRLTLDTPTGGARLGESEAFLIVGDDDDAPTVGVVGDAQVIEGNGGFSFPSVTVSLSAVSGRQVTMNYVLVAGTADAGADFSPGLGGGSITIPPGQTSQSLSFTVVADTGDEHDEQFTFRLTSAEGATIGDGEANILILDDDDPPAFSVADAQAGEPANSDVTATAEFVVSLDGPSGKVVTVNYATAGGSAAGGGVDFGDAAGTLTFLPGERSHTVSVPLRAEGRGAPAEPPETFTLTLSTPVNATLADAEATGTVLDVPFNFTPQAVADAATARPGEAVVLPLLANDTDGDGDGLTVTAVSAPARGTAAVTGAAAVTYTPGAGFVGTDTFTYTIDDGHGGTATALVTVTVAGAGITADPNNAAARVLVVGGGGAADRVRFERGKRGAVRVFLDDVEQSAPGAATPLAGFTGAGRVVVIGGGGDDTVVAGKLAVPVEFHGGDGNDVLTGGTKGDLLVGGHGDDTLNGGAGNDLAFGGAGADRLLGLGGNDILVAGPTAYDDAGAPASRAALGALLAAWNAGRAKPATRLAAIMSGNGVGGNARLNAETVFNDGPPDMLDGGGGTDLFHAHGATDVLVGRKRTEGLFEL